MVDKIGHIKNPLTIIAIFAGIAEVSGTAVLPFLEIELQSIFIYFLVSFPSILIILFFGTLNFNNKVLYAPSDYNDENNYVKIHKYDLSTQKSIEIEVPKATNTLNQLNELSNKIQDLEQRINIVIHKSYKPKTKEPIKQKEVFEQIEKLVSNFENASLFIDLMRSNGYNFDIYKPLKQNANSSYKDHRAIWLGRQVPLNMAKKVIKNVVSFYPHIDLLHVSAANDFDNDPQYGRDENMIYIGGATSTALGRLNVKPMNPSDFRKIQSINTLQELHEFIRTFCRNTK